MAYEMKAYPLTLQQEQGVNIHDAHEILSVTWANGAPLLNVVVNELNTPSEIQIRIYEAGVEFAEDYGYLVFLGSLQVDDETCYHVFRDDSEL